MIVVDTANPTIQCPANVEGVECTGNGSASANPGTATATDMCAGVNVASPPAGDFPRGLTTVTHVATDAVGNTASCTNTVTVVDTTPPIITCPDATIAECTGNSSAVVDPVPATDGSDICDTITFNDPPSATYSMGATAVTYTATDQVGLTASCTSNVVVRDTTPPEITCPATIVAECQGNRHATVEPGDATATDICAGVVVTDPPTASFPLGSSFVTHSAEDAVGLDGQLHRRDQGRRHHAAGHHLPGPGRDGARRSHLRRDLQRLPHGRRPTSATRRRS